MSRVCSQPLACSVWGPSWCVESSLPPHVLKRQALGIGLDQPSRRRLHPSVLGRVARAPIGIILAGFVQVERREVAQCDLRWASNVGK